MPAILFGSIGTIADTSEMQRQAFNKAFAKHGLDWHWERDEYIKLLEKSGGRQRIEDYAKFAGQSVDAEAIHCDKSEIFQQLLQKNALEPRPGVTEVIQKAKQENFKLALVTTTSKQNVASMLAALKKSLSPTDFDLIVDRSNVEASKPSEEAYLFVLEQLGQKPDSCVAIEDNLGGVKSAKSAAIACAAFPGENTAHHDFGSADIRVKNLTFEQLQSLLSS